MKQTVKRNKLQMKTKQEYGQFHFPLPGCIWHLPRVWFPFCRTEEACRRTPRRVAAVQRWPGTWPAGSPGPHRWPAAGRERRNKHCWHPPQECILHYLSDWHVVSWTELTQNGKSCLLVDREGKELLYQVKVSIKGRSKCFSLVTYIKYISQGK